MNTTFKLLLLIFVGCSIGSKYVYYNEMSSIPILKLNKNIVTIKTTNSIKNSALIIYKINISVNQNEETIILSAEQAVGKENKNIFTVNLTEYQVYESTNYILYWLDPDNKKTKLEVE